ncbi:putative non-specific serine/threonine protein kinase [Rosa chinensis]|uniref:non-specific serine/threonine protein kinase n=1 Tax=Rosa chinensis TaxID=74649 RepID=A0A2P6P4R8_ROSCH|nr:putative non-specific serine/threonine protein kinase [Rosa chinensis]
MFVKLSVLLVLLVSLVPAQAQDLNFIYNSGFNGRSGLNLSLDGIAEITPNGLLKLTNHTKERNDRSGHAFYPNPVTFKNSENDSAFSFSTNFIFAIQSEYTTFSGHGIAFVIAPTRGLPGALANQYMGLFNISNNGNFTNHVFAVELDTIQNAEFSDINENHVGIDINGLHSVEAAPAGYFDGRYFKNLTLISRKEMRVWVEYDGTKKQIEVTMAPIAVATKPPTPLLSLKYDLSPILNKTMYVGFSSSTGPFLTSHFVVGWSFRMNGQAQDLTASKLPKLPSIAGEKRSMLFTVGVPLISVILVLLVVSGVLYVINRKRKFAEVLEDWELEYGPQRFKYKELYIATKGFREKELLGTGGFGKIYRGLLPSSKIEIAVKRVSHESRQGMKEFVA